MGLIRVSRPAVVAQAVAIALVFCGSATAQPQQKVDARTAAAVDAHVVTVKIAAQPLESALDAFAAQTGLQVVYSSVGQIRDLQSPGFVGTLRADEVLSHLLAPSGLGFEFINSHTVAVRARTAAERKSPSAATTAKKIVLPPASAAASAAAEGKLTIQMAPVEVIGTNLRDTSPATPVQIIAAETIEQRGYSSIEDVLRHLPQNFSSTSSASAALGETEYGDAPTNVPFHKSLTSTLGASSVNLLGLGSRSTLVLVDGQRRTGSAQTEGGFTDISSIPVSQIERIEILGAGASAIYGADAVGGVVNIVLKKSYEGTVVQARHEYSASGADVNRVDLAHTFGWTNGRLTASAAFRTSDPPNIRRYIHVGPAGVGDFSDIGGADARIPNVGLPGTVFQTIDTGIPGFPFQGAPLGVIPSGQNGTSLQPSQLLPYSAATAPSSYPVARIGPQVKNPSLRLSGEQTFDNDLKLSYGVGYAQQRDTEYWHPIPSDFYFLVGSLTYVPTSNPYNHFGQDVLVGYSYDREFAGMTFSQNQKQTNTDYNVGLSGKLPVVKNWTFDLTYNGSKEQGRSDLLSDLDGAFGPEGYARIQPVVDGLNVFGDGNDPAAIASNRALLDTLVQRYINTFNSSANTVELLTRGALFTLPAGKVQAAIGAQYDTQRYHYESTVGGPTVSDSKRNDTAVFAELGLPLLKDVSWAKELTLTVAARHGSFNQRGTSALQNAAYNYAANTDLVALGGFDLQALTGATAAATSAANGGFTNGSQTPVSHAYANTSAQVGLVWAPVGSLRLRTTWGQSFLTPSPSQQFGPMYLGDFTYAVAYQGAQLPAGYQYVVQLSGANRNLKPQLATVKTIGFDYSPDFVNGLTVSGTYNDTTFKNYIGDPLGSLTYAQIFSDIDQMPASTFIKGNNGVLWWDARNVNFLNRRSRSLNTTASYYFTNHLGSWHAELNTVRTLELSSRTLPGMPVTEFSDSEFGPSKWVADLALGWEGNNYFASAGAHYSSAHRVLQPLSGYPSVFNNFTPTNPDPRRHSPSYTTMDFQVGYRWLDAHSWLRGSTVRLGVENAFDRAFPFVDNTVGFVSNRVDVRGRVIYLDLKKEF